MEEYPSPYESLGKELIVACEIYKDFWGKKEKGVNEAKRGISFDQLKESLKDVLFPKEISASLDVLLDYGIISPRDTCIPLKLDGVEKEYWARVYIPGQLLQRLMEDLVDDSWTYEVKGIIGRKQKRFYISRLEEIGLLQKEKVLINYILCLAQEKKGYKDGLLRVFTYKLLANILYELKNLGKERYIKIKRAQYGPIPVFPEGVVERELTISKACRIGGWRITEDGKKIRSGFSDYNEAEKQLSDHWKEIGQNIIGWVDAYLSIIKGRKVQGIISGKADREVKEAEILNILISNRNWKETVDNARFEYEAWSDWYSLFLNTLQEYQSYCGDEMNNYPKMYSHLRGAVEAYPPFYFKSLQDALGYRIEPDIVDIKMKLESMEKIPLSHLLKEQVGKFLQLTLVQSYRAANQYHKKIHDYLEIIGKIKVSIGERVESLKDPKFKYAAHSILNSIKDPSMITDKLREPLEKLMDSAVGIRGLVFVSSHFLPNFKNKEEIFGLPDNVMESFNQLEKLLPGVSKGDYWIIRNGPNAKSLLCTLLTQYFRTCKKRIKEIFYQLKEIRELFPDETYNSSES